MGNYYKAYNSVAKKGEGKTPLVNDSFVDVIYKMEGYGYHIFYDRTSKVKPNVETAIGGITATAIEDVFNRYKHFSEKHKDVNLTFNSKLANDMYKKAMEKSKSKNWSFSSILHTEANSRHETFKTLIERAVLANRGVMKAKPGDYTMTEIKSFGDEIALEYGNKLADDINNNINKYNLSNGVPKEDLDSRNLKRLNNNILNSAISAAYNRPKWIKDNKDFFYFVSNGSQDTDVMYMADVILNLSGMSPRRQCLSIFEAKGQLNNSNIKICDQYLMANNLKKELKTANMCNKINIERNKDAFSYEQADLKNRPQCSGDNIFSLTEEDWAKKVGTYTPKQIVSQTRTVKQEQQPKQQENNNSLATYFADALKNFGNAINLGRDIMNRLLQNNDKNAKKEAGENNDGNTNNNMQ